VEKFTAPDDYSQYRAAFGRLNGPMTNAETGVIGKAWHEWRERVERPIYQRLCEAELLCSAIQEYSHTREIFDRNLIPLMQVDYERSQILGRGETYEAVEIFEPAEIPLNIDFVPEWVLRLIPRPGFWHDEAYENVSLQGTPYSLGPMQGIIIQILYRGYLLGDPWANGQELLAKAGSGSEHLMDLFKGEKADLIVSNKRGDYRLNLDPT
jgi:hypothetical protein